MLRIQARTAQITEMRPALQTRHVIAAEQFLAAGPAFGAGLAVLFNVALRGDFFGGEVVRAAGMAGLEGAVPAGVADAAEGEAAVFADGEPVGWSGGGCGIGERGGGAVFVGGVGVGNGGKDETVGFGVFGGADGALAPCSGTVDGVSVRFD